MRHKFLFTVLMAFVFLCLICANIYYVVKQPYAGLSVEKKGPDWVVSKVDPNGMGIRSGVRRRDLILAVNNRPPEDFFNLKWGELEGFQSLEFLPPSGQPKIISLSNESLSVALLNGLPVLLLSMAFFILGLIALIRPKNEAASKEIFWLNTTTAIAIITSPISARSVLPAKLLELTCFSCLSFLLVKFAMVFPAENNTPIVKRIFRLSLIVTLVVLSFTFAAHLFQPGLIHTLRSLLLINALLGFAFSLLIINTSLRSTNYSFVRNQLMLVLMGIIIGISPFLILSAIPTIISRIPLVSSERTSLFIIFIPITIVYVLSNDYLPSASYLLRKLVINLAITLPVAAIIAGIIRFGLIYKSLSIYGIFISVLGVLLLFIYSYGRLQGRLEEIIFPGQVSYKRKLRQISDSLTGISSLDSLGGMLSESITKNMSLDGALFMLKKGEGIKVLSPAGKYRDNSSDVAFLSQYFLGLRKDPSDSSLPKGFPAAFLISLSKNSYRIGLFLGFELNKAFLSNEEVSLIAAIGKQVLLSVENIELLDALEQKIKQEQEHARNLRMLHYISQRKIEDERRAIAREIHDGPLQTAIHILRLSREYPCKKLNEIRHALEEIKEIEEKTEDLIYELRTVCTELRPSILDDLGFLPAVEWFVKKLMIEENLEIIVNTKGFNKSVRLERDIEITTFRLIQEMLNNAVKHSGAGLVHVVIRLNNNLIVKVSDNGKGFDTCCSKFDLLNDNKFGLIGMEERVQQLGGRLKISSRQGKGTSAMFFIPVADRMDGGINIKNDENISVSC